MSAASGGLWQSLVAEGPDIVFMMQTVQTKLSRHTKRFEQV